MEYKLFFQHAYSARLRGAETGSGLAPYEHGDSTNVFHVLERTVTVVQDEEEEERVEAPGVVLHGRGVPHGARNDTEDVVRFTASLCPLPGSG